MTTPPPAIDILQLGPWAAAGLETALAPRFRLLPLWQEVDEARDAYLAACAHSVRVVMTHTNALPTTRALIDHLPRLEVIVNLGSGSESVDMAAARERGIPVLSGAGANALDVAELAIGLMLAAGRGIVEGDGHVRANRWPRGRLPLTRRVSGKKLGILGMGAIGLNVARMAAGFDMAISYCSRRQVADVAYAYEPDLLRLATNVDFLIVAIPGGTDTHHLVNEAVLAALGPKGCLVNVARGTVVDEAALIRLLRDGCLGSAALDVFEFEPAVPDALRHANNVVLQAHRGGSTFEAMRSVVEHAVANLDRHFSSR
ncbi:2-hydroxyacid dehydrogenase [Hydrogenophaga sp.]|uniref:2-hydroxyacid dehydrogenase n=1 Tax=Hydrogenophaga sp. TaxID=1904254 RepID=UPI0027264368|nr:2-hydroxyacid dehydrogenase [Hydrogenophaga sp.]MDO9435330.1 2-hydroxyacid dehydrogenase [Hydrogenophaga sp.]